MQSSSTLPSSRRIPTLDGARSRGIYVQFYDPDGRRYGIPTYPYHWAPKHLYTTRQLRARGCAPAASPPSPRSCGGAACASPTSTAPTSPCPNGRPPPPSSPRSPRRSRARRTCPTCGTEKPYYIPRSLGECLDCTGR